MEQIKRKCSKVKNNHQMIINRLRRRKISQIKRIKKKKIIKS